LSALTEQALTIAAGFDWHKLAAFDPSSASPVTMVLEFFESNNRPPPLEREYVEKLQCFSYFDGMDRLPYRSMDVIYSLSRIGFDERLDELGALYRQTPMGLDQPMARYSVDDMYAITHALFYITDFGLRSPELSMTQAELSELRVALPTMLVLLFRADNVDLVAEVLLCWQFCGFQPEPAEKLVLGAALFCVLENQTKSGAVASTIDARNRELSTGAHFYELYHTTLVAAMLFALWGSRR
jgi:hypothetical protein